MYTHSHAQDSAEYSVYSSVSKKTLVFFYHAVSNLCTIYGWTACTRWFY